MTALTDPTSTRFENPGVVSHLSPVSNRVVRGLRFARAVLRSGDSWRDRATFAGEKLAQWSVRDDAHRLLVERRAGRDVCWEDEGDPEPLVTIRIPTASRVETLMERALPSALGQTYEHIEVVVIGEAASEAITRAMQKVRDPRVRYLNLARRGPYPDEPLDKWRVTGSLALNVGTALARGAWIAPCDDDDQLTENHVEVLLSAAKSRRLEMVYSVAEFEDAEGTWYPVGNQPLTWGAISHGSVLYSAALSFLSYSTTCYKIGDVHDWNLFRRMAEIGVRIGFVDRVTYRHYWSPFWSFETAT
jgi:glycosyltransferase involved in cell wall biosynthesis